MSHICARAHTHTHTCTHNLTQKPMFSAVPGPACSALRRGLPWGSGCSPPVWLSHFSSPSQSPTAVILCPAKEEATAVTAGVRGRTESRGMETDGERRQDQVTRSPRESAEKQVEGW